MSVRRTLLVAAMSVSLGLVGMTGCAEESTCGNGKVEAGEQCENIDEEPLEGATEVDTDGCTARCLLNVCGDGIVYDGVEECDDGNGIDYDGCTNDCRTPRCGDGIFGNTDGEE